MFENWFLLFGLRENRFSNYDMDKPYIINPFYWLSFKENALNVITVFFVYKNDYFIIAFLFVNHTQALEHNIHN